MKSQMAYKKKGIMDLSRSALAVVILVVVVAIGAQLLSTVRSTQTANTVEYNVTNKGLTALSTYGDWFTIIVIVVIASVVIVLLMGAFRGAGSS